MIIKKICIWMFYVILIGFLIGCNQPSNPGFDLKQYDRTVSARSTSTSMNYIMNGVGSNVIIDGSAWTTASGYYVGSGKNNYLYANDSIDVGDFTISAVMQLDTLNATAATFIIDGNHFGFDGSSNQLFVEGPDFGSTSFIGAAADYITPDTDFLFEVTRTGSDLSYSIDGIQVWSTTFHASHITQFGFRPWRNTIRIADFGADYDTTSSIPAGFLIDESWESLTDWTTTGTPEIDPAGQLHFLSSDTSSSVYREDVTVPSTYRITFTAQISDYTDGDAALGLKIQDGDYRLMFQRKADGFFVIDSSGSWTQIHSTSSYTSWAEYKIEVNNGVAILQTRPVGGNWDGPYTWNLATYTGADKIQFWCKALSSNSAESRIEDTLLEGSLEDLGSMQEVEVFTNGTDGYHTFRIPAIITAPNGDLLAFAEGRVDSGGDYGNIDVVMKRSSDNGVTWSALQVVAENGDIQAGNPCPVLDMMDPSYPNGRIFLLYNIADHGEHDVKSGTGVRETLYKTSIDNGVTWSSDINITTSVHKPNEPSVNSAYTFSEDWRWYALTPGHAIQLTRTFPGRLFIPANHSLPSGDYYSHAFYSDDHGATWQLGGTVTINTNEVEAVELTNGDVMMNMRNYRGTNRRRVAVSSDGGDTWSASWDSQDLLEPVCQASILRYTDSENDDKDRLLFSNPSSTERYNMTIKVSYDEGLTWNVGRTIYTGLSAYSDLVIRSDKSIGIFWEKDGYQSMWFSYFSLDWATFGTDTLTE